jgi:hypothetical protein
MEHSAQAGGANKGHFLTSASSSDSILARRNAISSKNVTSWAAPGFRGPNLLIHFMHGLHDTHAVWLKGNSLTAHSAGASGTSDPGTPTITDTLNIGARNNAASLGLTGEIASIVLFSPALSWGQQMAVARMLARKYDLPLA